jgi:hypothetical protein
MWALVSQLEAVHLHGNEKHSDHSAIHNDEDHKVEGKHDDHEHEDKHDQGK